MKKKLYKEELDIFWRQWFAKYRNKIEKREKRVIPLAYFQKSVSIKESAKSIYLIECQGFFKIGSSVNVKERIAELQVGNPFLISFVASRWFRFSVHTERDLHRMLLTKRVVSARNKEWFILNRAELGWIKEFLSESSLSPVESSAHSASSAVEPNVEKIAEGIFDS